MQESKDQEIKLFGMKIHLSTVLEAEEDGISAEKVLILALLLRWIDENMVLILYVKLKRGFLCFCSFFR